MDLLIDLVDRKMGAQVVVGNQGKTLSIIDYMSDAETTKVRSRIQEN
jgi:hypothetical protein